MSFVTLKHTRFGDLRRGTWRWGQTVQVKLKTVHVGMQIGVTSSEIGSKF
jgi:hypothetical protein